MSKSLQNSTIPSTEWQPVSERLRPTYIGEFHVKSEIASGGMGRVYLATQSHPRRTVAVKVMKRGIGSHSARRRFEHESQVLARLRHPGIARVYAAGMYHDGSESLPYFAMEYIPSARPITDYANEHNLDLYKRLMLFMEVCDAVHHGHQKGIIHRDLKPGNILVDADGHVRIIDFGVARSTDADMAMTTDQTAVGELIGTLKYMSPEQCAADPHDIDTGTDVYTLGVVLYELLSGQLPYDLIDTPVLETTRRICEEPPTPLGRIHRSMGGDIETIVGKALEKDRAHRYQSAHSLANDIRCYLVHEPVSARSPTVIYRLSKFVRKHRVPLAFVAILLVALVAISGSQFSRHIAEKRLHDAYHRYLQTVSQTKAGINDPAGVIEDATAALELKPDFAEAYALRAKAYFEDAQYDLAEPDCRKALDLDPDNSLALRVQAYLLLERGEFQKALHAYNQGIAKLSLEVDLPRDLHNRARIQRILGRYDLAMVDNERAVALTPNTAVVYVGRGLTHRCSGHIREAIEDLSQAAELDKGWGVQCNLWIWEMRRSRDALEDRQEADGALQAALAAADDDDRKYVDVVRGDLTAEGALRTAAGLDEQCFTYYYLGARAVVEGRHREAVAWFRRCRDTGAHYNEEHMLAGWHLQRLEDLMNRQSSKTEQESLDR